MCNSFAVRMRATNNAAKPLFCDHQRSMKISSKNEVVVQYYRDDQGPKNWSQ